MTKKTRLAQGYRKVDDLYDSNYYERYDSQGYSRSDHWLKFFSEIAENIIQRLNPSSVLDAGCAYGLLVESFRDRGVEAYGIDVSSFAISKARADIKQFLSRDTILRPQERRYDLLISIEVIEHIKPEDCDLAIKNMCAASDTVLISTIPDDFDDPTHFNVNPPVYWIRKFSSMGFEPDLDFYAGFLTPYAILFRRKHIIEKSVVQKIYGEKKLLDLDLSRKTHELNVANESFFKNNQKLKGLQNDFDYISSELNSTLQHVKNLEDIIEVERNQNIALTRRLNEISNSVSWRLTKPLRLLSLIKQFFTPVFRTPIELCARTEIGKLQGINLKKWVCLEADVINNYPVQLALLSGKSKNRQIWPLFALVSKGNHHIWLARVANLEENYEITIIRGEPQNIKVTGLSSFRAWLEIFSDRWKKGGNLAGGLRLFRRLSHSGLRAGASSVLPTLWPSEYPAEMQYENWLSLYDSRENHTNVDGWISNLQCKPKVSIILPVFKPKMTFLQEAVASVRGQSYQNWELCIVDDASNDAQLASYLGSLLEDKRIKLSVRKTNGHISEASNTALDMASGDFVTFLDHDDVLHKHALAVVADSISKNPYAEFFYSDEDKLLPDGKRGNPFFKPNWNPDLLLSQNYICHLVVYRRSLVVSLGGFRTGFEGAQDYDLALRMSEVAEEIIHIPYILYHWRSVEGSTALNKDEKPYADKSAKTALTEAVERRQINAKISETSLPSYHRVVYDLPEPPPLVSIIIPTRDQVDLLRTCVEGLLNKTDYQTIEILIIDNNSTNQNTLDFFNEVQDWGVKVLSYPGDFNYSAINNYAVDRASGDILLFLNNDIEIIDAGWLRELVSQTCRSEVGAVGARLYYPDDTVQHDGIIIGIGGVAGYAHPGLSRYKSGEFGRSLVSQNYSAMTAAVLAIKKSIFREVGGFDEVNLAVAFNDVDFCLKVMEAGYLNVFTPFAELYHHESVSRGPDTDPDKAARFSKEASFMKDKWSKLITNDPFYNPNLSLRHGYSIDLKRGHAWPWEVAKTSKRGSDV